MSAGALLLAAGRGERLGVPGGKALVPLAGRPLFAWALEALERTPEVAGIVVVGDGAALRAALGATPDVAARVVGWCEGGATRQDSVARGLAALPPAFDLVVVHDAARALVTPRLITAAIADALEHGAAIAAAPLEDTVKRARDGWVEATLEREGLWRIQTPQVFRRAWLEAGHASARAIATDDAALVEALGHRVWITPSDALNFKITTPADLALAEAWLACRGTGAARGRVGSSGAR
jgi:2-C-methyl-D-erythritol 4-phosphate cytidylyltransferase